MRYDTLEYLGNYKSLADTINMVIAQAVVSVPYCQQIWGTNNSIYDIWQIGKNNLIYVNDHPDIEQIQSVGTLFENNIHGKPGAGDCDCFTVFALAMCLASGHDFNKIVLQGNKKSHPTHILLKSNKVYLDFTNENINEIRPYNFKQEILC